MFCAAACILVAVLCAFNHEPILAAAQSVAAVVVWRVGLRRTVDSLDLDTFINKLQDASHKAENGGTTVLATLWANVIYAPMPPLSERFLPSMSIRVAST